MNSSFMVNISLFVLTMWLGLAGLTCSSAPPDEDKIVLVMVGNDRDELVKAIDFLNLSGASLICVNVPLNCNQDDSDLVLSDKLMEVNSLVLPSKIRPFGSHQFMNIIGCSVIYPENAPTGYTNLIDDKNTVNKVRPRFALSGKVVNHMATEIAIRLNEDKTQKYLKSHGDTVSIDFSPRRKFATYHLDEFKDGNANPGVLVNKTIILTTFPFDAYLIQNLGKKGTDVYMSSSEIIANIAYQMIGR